MLLSQMKQFTQSHPTFLRFTLILFPLIRLDSYLLFIHVFLSKTLQVFKYLSYIPRTLHDLLILYT